MKYFFVPLFLIIHFWGIILIWYKVLANIIKIGYYTFDILQSTNSGLISLLNSKRSIMLLRHILFFGDSSLGHFKFVLFQILVIEQLKRLCLGLQKRVRRKCVPHFSFPFVQKYLVGIKIKLKIKLTKNLLPKV